MRALSQEEFGEYNFIISVVGILTVFALKGLDNAVMQSVARGAPGTFRKSVPLALLASLIGLVVLAGISVWFWLSARSDLALGFAMAACLFPFARALEQWKSIKVGHEKFPGLVKLESVALICMHAAIIASAIFYPGQYILPLAFVFAVPAVQNIVMTSVELRRIPTVAPDEPDSVRYGIKTSLYSSLGLASQHADRLLLFFLLSPSALALFVAASQVSDLVYNVIQDMAAVLAPRFAKHKVYSTHVDRAIRWFSLAISAAVLIFAFTLLPWLFALIYGAAYSDALPYAQALLVAVAIGNVATFHFRFIRSRLDTNNYRSITVLTSLARIGAACLCIPAFGLAGAVASVFIYRLALLASVQRAMHKDYKPV